jgi:glycosyltransferase involved in cell wall biosynthesis
VLVISSLYPPHHVGGYELTCRDVVERWQRAGHEVTVLTSDTRLSGVADHPDQRGHVLRRFRLYDPPLDLPPPRRRDAVVADFRNRSTLTRALRGVRPDVVSVWHMGGLGLSLLRQLRTRHRPTVLVVCDDWMTYAPTADPVVRLRGRAIVPDLGAFEGASFCSAWLRSHVEATTPWRFPSSQVAWLGVDPEAFPVRSPVDRQWCWRLLYVGRVDAHKGVDTLVRALVDLPAEATLDVLGRATAEYQRYLELLVKELGLGGRVRFGVATREELNARYRDADALVFPSEWAEPFGIVPLEAMACGTPVVATGTGGSGEYLMDGENCLRFTAGDAPALAAALLRVAGDASLRATIVRGGSASAASITVDRLAESLEALHANIGQSRV